MSEAEPKQVNDDELKERLRLLLAASDLATTTEKKLRKQLEEEFGVSLSDKKALIRREVEEFLEAQQDGEEDADGAEEEDAEGEEEADEEEGQEEAEARKRKRNTGGGMGSLLSEEMQQFLGVERMARTQVVKAIWAYIKENDLQDPRNKRKIIVDAKLGTIFTSPLDMFSMNKQLSRHVKTNDAAAVVGGSASEDDEPRQSKPRPKAASKPAAKRGKKAEDSDGGGGSKKGGGGYTKPVKISAELAALVGTDSISRPELTKFFWGYFREHELFDPTNKQFVIADEPLKKLFNEERFRAFSVAKYFNQHVVK